jgi:uncharacterized protein YyaL (SSP411 family)
MRSSEGGFYSAEDADSEGVEGKVYLWTEEEIRRILPQKDAELFVRVFNVTVDGNFSEEASGQKTGMNILYMSNSLEKISRELGVDFKQLKKMLEDSRQRLFSVRKKRIHPGKDRKVLTDWNGLMIAAFALAARVFGEKKYSQAAEEAVRFIYSELTDSGGRLFHRYKDGVAGIPGFLDDYAFLLWGLIELYETTFEAEYLKKALSLSKIIIERFWDVEGGGFYFTPDDGEELILRKKEIYDGAHPSGNSVAMLTLLRLARLTGDTDLEKKSLEIARAFSSTVEKAPAAYTYLMSAVDFAMGPGYEVIIVGSREGEDTAAMLRALRGEYLPNKVVLLISGGSEQVEIAEIAGFARHFHSKDGRATTYVCSNYSCKKPTSDPVEMLRLLRAQ